MTAKIKINNKIIGKNYKRI